MSPASTPSASASSPRQLPGTLRILDQLHGTDCPECHGRLEHGAYKGNRAVVCQDCGTPRVQVFA